jgi:putative transposase
VHHHSGIAMMTPHTMHHGQLTEERGATLMAVFAAHAERFKGLAPTPNRVPQSVWINRPIKEIAKPEIIINGPLNTPSLVSPIH